MRDSILTIPINEVFEPKDGCPFCRMKETIEKRCVEYIMGAAMMEPDVRMKSNEMGFCKHHFDLMLKEKNRLSLGLILSTHLLEIKSGVADRKLLFQNKRQKYRLSEFKENCFVCDRVEWGLERLFVTFFEMYQNSSEFRELFSQQDYICMHHYDQILSLYEEKMTKNKKVIPQLLDDSKMLFSNKLNELIGDVTHFTKMFDYRNSQGNADWGNSKDSIQRAIEFLTSQKLN